MSSICYLCGEAIDEEDHSADHVVPKQFIKRSQPKAKGFDYAGVLASHESCNNQFRSEVYSQKALVLLRALHDTKCFYVTRHPDDSSVPIMALNSDCFPGFQQRDLEFFKLIDARTDEPGIPSADDIKRGEKTDAKRSALHTALAVLAKSAAAQLISRKLEKSPSYWKLVAIPYVGARQVDLDSVFGSTKPFETDVKSWIGQFEGGDWLVVYKAEDILVFFSSGFRREARPSLS